MKKLILLILPALLPIIGVHAATVYNLFSNVTCSKESAIPACIEISRIDNGFLLSFSLEEFEVNEDDIYPGAFTISIPGFGITNTAGEPGLPIMFRNLAFDKGASLRCRVISCDSVLKQLRIAPARPFLTRENEGFSKSNVPAIGRNSSETGQSPIHLAGSGLYRGVQLANVALCPVHYDYETMQVKVYNRFTCEITVDENVPMKVADTDGIDWTNDPNDPILKNSLFDPPIF